jgi:hypothetical protein
MRLVAWVLVVTGSIASADECTTDWAHAKQPSADYARRCVRWWADNHHTDQFAEEGIASVLNDEIITQISSDDFQAMADHTKAICPETGGHDYELPCMTRLFFESAAEARTSLKDANDEPLGDVVAKVFAGKRLTVDDIAFMSPTSLWKLRNAPYARHGMIFKTADLRTLYAQVGDYAPNKKFDESMLDANDEANVKLVADAQSGAVAIAHTARYWYCKGQMKCCTWGNPEAACPVDRSALVGLCEEAWPEGSAGPDAVEQCRPYYDGASPDDAVGWGIDAKTERKMADELGPGPAADFLRTAADAHFSLIDPHTQKTFEPILRAILAGKLVKPTDLKPLAGVTLWRLRAAPQARHGKPEFRSPDLATFFYQQLKLKPNQDYDGSQLDSNDQTNIDTIEQEQQERQN